MRTIGYGVKRCCLDFETETSATATSPNRLKEILVESATVWSVTWRVPQGDWLARPTLPVNKQDTIY
jgi:hypothetical protein